MWKLFRLKDRLSEMFLNNIMEVNIRFSLIVPWSRFFAQLYRIKHIINFVQYGYACVERKIFVRQNS